MIRDSGETGSEMHFGTNARGKKQGKTEKDREVARGLRRDWWPRGVHLFVV